jgi:hypothetical protein
MRRQQLKLYQIILPERSKSKYSRQKKKMKKGLKRLDQPLF